MSPIRPSAAREQALRALDRESRYFREQAALAGEQQPDVRDLWLALADQVDGYLAVEQGGPVVPAGTATLLELVEPP